MPYQLERPTGLDKDPKKMPRLNRYYEKLKPYYKINESDFVSDKTLIFESRFESGNLKRAVKV